jgi:glycosyltransferase involved in cell wall biosynthesis
VGCRLDLVEEGRTGFVFRSGDAEGLREIMGRFLQNPALCSTLGAEAHARVQGYTVEKAADAIERAARLVRSS